MALIVLLFIVLPFVELTLLLRIGSAIGAMNTLGIVVATGLLGGYLAKHEGLAVLRRFQAKLASGAVPGDELLDGVIVLASGALLVTPGVITDAIGLLGLFPPTRVLIKRQIRKRVTLLTTVPGADGFTSQDSRPETREKVDITRIVERRTGQTS